ncbi:transketolase [Lentibacillus kapialis]|uniref:Transketolase n=1 Tax=Lentibacillus kapialis TaxID=340214 RepID=A0A917PW64_9BACI|nr:transketolase [Lentibacillus kapialis]GGJ95749.1 transketolase [Lentibacillus kapialis]
MQTASSVSKLSINTIRTLTLDSVENAQHGHPGMPIGSAPMAYTLWKSFMNINPNDPNWFNRDRFVLSAGHGSMLHYALLHLSGFDVAIEDLKGFRQWGSITPGHPEYGMTPGVEVTTGPLGQGVPAAVGMALAEKHLASVYNKQAFQVIDHYTYAICSDGDLMEGVSYEAASFAGHMRLNKLIMLYDSNGVSLDDNLEESFSDDIQKRFESMGWHYLYVEDGRDTEEIAKQIREAQLEETKPTIIEVKNVIGYGLEGIEGTHNAHSDPVGQEAIEKAKTFYNWDYESPFYVPDEVYKDFSSIRDNGSAKQTEWNELFDRYKSEHPQLAKELERVIKGELPAGWENELPAFETGEKVATRVSASETLNNLGTKLPELTGGSADLATSNKAVLKEHDYLSRKNYAGRNVRFGVREFAMGAIANGMALHGLRPFVSTFFVFSDYLRPSIRLAALMGLPITYIFTHDSIAVGQDGPTHQPVEHLASFRAMPNMSLIRPADANETKAAWKAALMQQSTPTMLVLGRQGVPTLEATQELAESGVMKGAYILSPAKQDAEGILLASGSEVHLVLEAQSRLANDNIYVDVVSMPSWDLFDQQSQEYKDAVLKPELKKRLVVELGSKVGWKEYAGDNGAVMSIDMFGASAPGDEVIEQYGFTVEKVAERYKLL